MDPETRLKRLRYRAWHRGTREADLMIGGFLDAHGSAWSETELVWFEAFLEEQDVDIMAWAMGVEPCPDRWEGDMMQAMRRMDFVPLPTQSAAGRGAVR
jgi:antitoxin CptB